MADSEHTPTLSLCIPTYNRAELLEYYLDNLAGLDEAEIDYEVVVLNHASTDGTADMLKKKQKNMKHLRVYHQKHQVSLSGQFIAAARLAKGKYTICMADDDKLIVDKLKYYIDFMESQEDVVACYTPWQAYDDEAEKVLHGYFDVPEKVTFNKEQGFELFAFIAQKGLYPEIALFRTDVLQQVMFTREGGAFHHFIWLYELSKRGTVAFLPENFYLEVAVVKSRFNRDSRLNLELTLSYLDNFRAGLELMVMRIIHDLGGDRISPETRNNMHEALLNYLLARVQVAFNRAMHTGDFLAASELAQRIMLWRGPFRQDLMQCAQHALFGAGVQQAVWLFQSMSWKEELVLFGFEASDGVETMLKKHYPDISVRVLDEQKIRDSVDAEKALLLVKLSRQKEQFSDMFLPGHIISLEETTDYFKFFPMKYTLEAAA